MLATSKRKKVLFVLHPQLGYATARIRGTIYVDVLARNGWDATFATVSSTTQGPELDQYRKSDEEIIGMSSSFDVIYLVKANSYELLKALRAQSSAKIVFDLTDALWRRGFRKNFLRLEDILGQSDAVFSENEYVCEYARRYNDSVFSLPACTQIELVDEIRRHHPVRVSDKVRLGWIGSESTVNAVYSIAPVLEQLFRKHKNLELRILGASEIALRKLPASIQVTTLPSYTEKEMISEALQMDIGLFPSPGDIADYRIRGALKAMIYMSAGIPAVCLDAGDAQLLIDDGVNGFLIRDQSEWLTKLERLILDGELRKSMGALANDVIRKEHSLEHVGFVLAQALDSVLKLQPKTKPELSLPAKFKVIMKSIIYN